MRDLLVAFMMLLRDRLERGSVWARRRNSRSTMGAHASSLLRDGDTPEEPTVAASELEGAGVVFDHVAFAAAAT